MPDRDPFVPHEVPDNFDQEMWKADASEAQKDYEVVRKEVLKTRRPQKAIGPRQNLIDDVEPFTVNGKRNKNFQGDEHKVYIVSNLPPSPGTLIYKNTKTGAYVSMNMYLPEISLSAIVQYAKPLFKEAKKANKRSKDVTDR